METVITGLEMKLVAMFPNVQAKKGETEKFPPKSSTLG